MEISAVPPNADQHCEGQHDEHEGKSHGRAGDAVGAQGMTDEDAVDQIVRSLGHHPDDGRKGETKQQARNAGLPELCRTIRRCRQSIPDAPAASSLIVRHIVGRR